VIDRSVGAVHLRARGVVGVRRDRLERRPLVGRHRGALAHVGAGLIDAEADVLALVAVEADLLRLHLAHGLWVAAVVLRVGEAPDVEQAPVFEDGEERAALLFEHVA
jgi:hypothetical protein